MSLIEKDLSTLVFFRGWDWDVDMGIDFNSHEISREEKSNKIKVLYKEYGDKIESLVRPEINNYSHADQGVFAEINTSYLLRDYISTGNISFDRDYLIVTDIYNIYVGSASKYIVHRCNEYLEHTVSADIEWNCFLVNLIPLGYEEDYEAFPQQIPEKQTPWIKASVNDMYLKKSDFFKLIGVDETSSVEKKNKSLGISVEKSNAMTTASNIAASLWRMEQHKDKRISEMANEVYAELYRLGFADQLPEKLENMTSWIRTVAPEHAKKAGRPPKTITPNLK